MRVFVNTNIAQKHKNRKKFIDRSMKKRYNVEKRERKAI